MLDCFALFAIPDTVIYCGLNEGIVGTVLYGKGVKTGEYRLVHSDLTLQKAVHRIHVPFLH